MDAKVGDWVVTPRRGKAVEINALWYNALSLLEGWMREEHGRRCRCRYRRASAERAGRSFNERFWCEEGYLYDVVDGEHGDDDACRPNQILAIIARPPGSRSEPLASGARRRERAAAHAGTDLRSLAPGSPTTSPDTTATCVPATPPTIRERFGPG